ncbi:MAG TPA: type IV secretory system conjugative DNA transfer family protein [Blastocatellia bacterium]|nr:type IV secretory system conjugative DNA transfer family protein [Blastocatellia bacterium]
MLALSNWEQLKVGPDDRAILIGATGTGKTWLAKALMEDRAKPFQVVYDTKGLISSPGLQKPEDRWIGYKVYTNFDVLIEEQKRHVEKFPRVIYRPPIEEERDAVAQDIFFNWIYDRWKTRLYVDEAYSILGGTNPSQFLQACLSRGRERKISTLISTQRPARIPVITMSESEHIFVFRLNAKRDRETAGELIDVDPRAFHPSELKDHQFYYFNGRVGQPSGIITLDISAHKHTHTQGDTSYERQRTGRPEATISA